jgi:hypothetical protein
LSRAPAQRSRDSSAAESNDDLHSNNNKLSKETALNEKGEPINGRGDKPNMHDVLTGSQPDGRAFSGGEDKTCHNWTSSKEGAAMLGHHDRQGLRDDESSGRGTRRIHPETTPRRASVARGNGLFYCFAVN